MPSEDPDDSDTEAFEPICRKWLQINATTGAIECMWPKGELTAARLQNLVHKQVDPDASWESHPCEVVSSYETYLEAHLGAKARETNPHYETEREVGKLRKRITRKIISSEEEDEDNPKSPRKSIPSPPKINSRSNKTFKPVVGKSPVKVSVGSSSGKGKFKMPVRKNKGSKLSDIDDLKAMLNARKEKAKKSSQSSQLMRSPLNVTCTSPNWKAKTATEGGEVEECAMEVDDDLFDRTENMSPKSPKGKVTRNLFGPVAPSPLKVGQKSSSGQVQSQKHSGKPLSSRERSPSPLECHRQSPETVNFSLSTQSKVKPHSDQSVSLERSSKKDSSSRLSQQRSSEQLSETTFNSFEKQVLMGVKELKEMLQVISANQSKLNLNLLPNEKVISMPAGMPALPVKTMHDLNSLESYLEESDNVSNLSVYLSAFVSKKETDEAKSALKVMSKVIGNALASKFSLQGLKGKLKFTDLKLWSAVQGAILWKLETDLSEAKKAVANWLKNAPWRSHEDSSATTKRQSSSKHSSHDTTTSKRSSQQEKSSSVSSRKSTSGKSQSERCNSQ